MNNAVYLLLGPETGQKQTWIDKIAGDLTSQKKETIEQAHFYAFDADVREILALCQNEGLFCTHRLILLHHVEALSTADAALVKNYCQKPSVITTLVMTSPETKVSAALENAVPESNKKIFWELFENQKKQWVIQYFHNLKIKIDQDALEMLLDTVENDTAYLSRECKKLQIFFKSGDNITSEWIEQFLFHSKEENVFTLFDKIAVGNLVSSLEILQKIFLSTETNAVQILNGLLWQFKKLHKIKILQEQNIALAGEWNKLNIKSKHSQHTYLEAAQLFSIDDIKNILLSAHFTDSQLKNAKSEMHLQIIQLFIYTVITKRFFLKPEAHCYQTI